MTWGRSRVFARAGRIITIILSLLLFGSTCNDSATEPPPPEPLSPSSHEWTWEHTIIDPENTSGWLWDVCYINDTCIWAVGKIGHSTGRHNACRWNGNEWVLEQVLEAPTGSATEPGVHQLYTVYGTTPNNVWFCSGVAFVRWNGSEFISAQSFERIIREPLNKSWGSASDNIYMGGYNGEIVHYNGHRWRRLDTGIEWDITGMHGVGDTLLVAATDWEYTGNTKFYTVIGETVKFLMESKFVRGVSALWYTHLNDVYTTGPYHFHFNGSDWRKVQGSDQLPVGGFGRDMAANNCMDIIDCGDFGSIRHFNGEDWRQWKDVPGYEYAAYNGCTIHGNRAWVVGEQTEGGEVLIVAGTRTGN